MKLAYKIDPNDVSIRSEITRITDEYLKIFKRSMPKTISVVDELIDDEKEDKMQKKNENYEQKMKNMESFISTITEKKKKKKKSKKEKNLQNELVNNLAKTMKALDFTNKQDLINEEEQDWSDLEEEKNEFDINESDFELTYEINSNAIIPDEIKELGRFLSKKSYHYYKYLIKNC